MDADVDKIAGQNNSNRSETPSVKLAGIIFSLGVFLLIFIGFRVQHQNFYSGILITEIVLIMAPVVVLLYFCRYDVRKVLRLNRVSILTFVLVFLIMLLAMPAVSVLNLANLAVLKMIFGKVLVAGMPVATDLGSLIAGILVIGVLPGICEEIMFRGGIQKGLERVGTVRGILITAFLFGLMHLDFQKFLGTFLLGALIGFIVYRTNSLFAGMFAHFVNNSASVVISFGLTYFYRFLSNSGVKGFEAQMESQGDINVYLESFASVPAPQLLFTIAVWAFMFIGSAAGVWGLMVALNHVSAIRHSEPLAEPAIKANNSEIKGLLWFIPGFAVVAFRYIAQGMAMLGIKGDLAKLFMIVTGIG